MEERQVRVVFKIDDKSFLDTNKIKTIAELIKRAKTEQHAEIIVSVPSNPKISATLKLINKQLDKQSSDTATLHAKSAECNVELLKLALAKVNVNSTYITPTDLALAYGAPASYLVTSINKDKVLEQLQDNVVIILSDIATNKHKNLVLLKKDNAEIEKAICSSLNAKLFSCYIKIKNAHKNLGLDFLIDNYNGYTKNLNNLSITASDIGFYNNLYYLAGANLNSNYVSQALMGSNLALKKATMLTNKASSYSAMVVSFNKQQTDLPKELFKPCELVSIYTNVNEKAKSTLSFVQKIVKSGEFCIYLIDYTATQINIVLKPHQSIKLIGKLLENKN